MDEYDQIDRDLVPFLALSPETAQKLRDVLSEQDPMWFVGAAIKDGVAELHDDREIRRGIHRLTPSFEHLLPDMNWYTHLHDMSPYTIDQELRDEAKEALLSGTYMDLETVKQFENPNRNTRRGVLKGCLEDAPSVIQEIDLTLKTTPHVQTRSSFEFIHTLHTTMDICHNQALFDNQCLFSGTHPRDARLRPLFIQSKTVHGGGIMTPTEYGFGEHDDKLDTPWSQRSPRVYWRGTNTGNCPPNHLRNSPRVRLHMMAQDNPLMSSDDTVHILVEDFTEEDDEEDTHEAGGGLRVEEVSMKKFNAEFMDVGLVGPPIQCGDKDNCALMEKEIGFLPRVSRGSRGEGNKYTIDVDGNGWSGRFRGLLGGGSVVFKFTNFPEWNTDRMMPYYHYVPIQHDFSDLYNSVAFFTGTPEGKGAHDKMAERIGANAVDYVRKHWRWQDMEVYVYRLLLEYARVMSSDRDAMTYQPAPPPARPL
ncbi:F-actin-capping protein subunit alpha [Tulasnella sp. JGI-2019a]|nr:F-actin-capping protein subunit alpha [Tulasnella sp. JGI-2019a]